jgi:hypothetical protein
VVLLVLTALLILGTARLTRLGNIMPSGGRP